MGCLFLILCEVFLVILDFVLHLFLFVLGCSWGRWRKLAFWTIFNLKFTKKHVAPNFKIWTKTTFDFDPLLQIWATIFSNMGGHNKSTHWSHQPITSPSTSSFSSPTTSSTTSLATSSLRPTDMTPSPHHLPPPNQLLSPKNNQHFPPLVYSTPIELQNQPLSWASLLKDK